MEDVVVRLDLGEGGKSKCMGDDQEELRLELGPRDCDVETRGGETWPVSVKVSERDV